MSDPGCYFINSQWIIYLSKEPEYSRSSHSFLVANIQPKLNDSLLIFNEKQLANLYDNELYPCKGSQMSSRWQYTSILYYGNEIIWTWICESPSSNNLFKRICFLFSFKKKILELYSQFSRSLIVSVKFIFLFSFII